MKLSQFFLRSALLGGLSGCLSFNMYAHELDMIPLPKEYKVMDTNCILTKNFSISILSPECKKQVEYFARKLRRGTGWPCPIVSDSDKIKGILEVSLEKKLSHPQQYQLSISKGKISLRAATPQAVAFGLQALLQLMPPSIYAEGAMSEMSLPCVDIQDAPVAEHRGVSLDVSRYFQDKEAVIKMLEALASCRMSTFQWHLTDDQGWRFPSKAYPKLTEGGPFYSVDDVKEIVERAHELGIKIIPEIDLPGHSHALTKAYPEFGTVRKDGKMSNVLNVGKPDVYEFVETILGEVNELIPGDYFHIGADEVARGVWANDPDCIALMEKHNIKDVHQLQAYFTKRMAEMLRKLNRKPLAWDEAFEGDLEEAKDVGIVSWRFSEPGVRASKAGHPVVMSPGSRLYFDKANSRSKDQPHGYGNHTMPLHLVYSFVPYSPTLSEEQKKNILGAQAGIWGEMIRSKDHVFLLAFPRACALSEALWTPSEKKDWHTFVKRMDTMKKRLDAMGVKYFWEDKTMPLTVGTWTPDQVKEPKSVLSYPLSKDQMSIPGYYEINADYTKGTGTVDVLAMELYNKAGALISRDEHTITSTLYTRRASENCFYLKVEEPGEYTLKVYLSPKGEGACYGLVQMIKPLPKEEYTPKYDLDRDENRNKQPENSNL